MNNKLRDSLIGFKVTAKEKASIERAARKLGMTPSAYIRWKMIYKDKEGE